MASNATAQLPPYLAEQAAHITDDRSWWLTVATVICGVVACLAVVLRFIARYRSSAKYQWDDWLIVIGLIFGLACIIITGTGITVGIGRHAIVLAMSPSMTASYGRIAIAAEAIYNPAILAIKGSILLLYRRIFPSRKFHMIVYALFAFIACYTTAIMFACIFQCIPIDAFWDATIEGKCINSTAVLEVSGILNIVTDVIILAIPVPLVWKLKTKTSSKIQIIGLFLTGGLVTCISIVRVIVTSQIDPQDPTWSEIYASIFSNAEVGAAIVSACLPTLRPLFVSKAALRSTSQQYSQQYPISQRSRGFSRFTNHGDDNVPLHDIKVDATIKNSWHDSKSSDKDGRGEDW